MINNSVVKKLRKYWQELLNIEDADIHDNFFSLGGDALLFKALVHKVKQDFNININDLSTTNFSTLYQQESVIKKCLNILPQSIVISLQEGKEKADEPIVVIIHPIGGSLFSFMSLITKMHSSNKIYGIQDCVLTGDMRRFDSLAEQVSFYIAELQKFIKGKRIILMGYSAGGSLANEMAYQLSQQGDVEVQHLVLFDSWTRMPAGTNFRDNFISIIVREFDKIRPYSFFNTQEQIDYWLEVLWSRMRSVFMHRPKQVEVNTTLFVPIESVPEYIVDKEMTEGWSQFVKHLDIHYVKGNHENMLDEFDLTPIIKELRPIFKCNTSGAI